jgi:two-component system sensor histidine kinase ChvG
VISKLTFRLLIFNLLLVFFPIGILLYLDTYEKQLLQQMESSMVQQGRVLAASLMDSGDLEQDALRIIRNMAGKQTARIRIVNGEGRLLADSSSPGLQPPAPPAPEDVSWLQKRYGSIGSDVDSSSRSLNIDADIRDNWLYKAAVYPLNILRRLIFPPSPPLASADVYSGGLLDGPEIRAALDGRYGAYTRYSGGGQRSVTLYSALPVYKGGEVNAAVLVSRSTFRILNDLYALRLDMVRVFLFSVLAAVALSLLLARTITIPVKKLRDQAERFLDHRGRMRGQFRSLRNRDEIGDLSRSLNTLSDRLERYIRFMDGFSADLSHELKNPVASILNAAELSREAGDEDRGRFLGIIESEGRRISRLIGDLRDISRMDLRLGEESPLVFDPGDAVRKAVEAWNSCSAVKAEIDRMEPLYIRAGEDRIVQCLSNLLDNAGGFSPADQSLSVRLYREEDHAVLSVLDRGPGIAPGNEDKLKLRFFSDRPGEAEGSHSGLGLSIVDTIARAYGGSLRFGNRRAGGARFSLRLPLADRRESAKRQS